MTARETKLMGLGVGAGMLALVLIGALISMRGAHIFAKETSIPAP